MDIRLGVVPGLPAAHPGQGGLDIHIQIDHQIRPGQAHLAVFQIGQPGEEVRQFILRQLGPLVDSVGGRVPVRQDQGAVFVKLPPVRLIGRIAVHRVEGGCGVGVHIIGMSPELSGQVHAYQSAALLLIPGKHNMIIGDLVLFHSCAQASIL